MKARMLFIAATFALTSLATAPAGAQDSGPSAMRRLAFLNGSWTCTIKGGKSDGLVEETHYSFSPDGAWMMEVSHDKGSQNDFATQMWGYNATAKKMVAYQFLANGVFTKSVDGWVDDSFVGHRDDNGATVSLKRTGDSSARWTIESADHSYIVREDCTRSS
jgi:hypothetical protein